MPEIKEKMANKRKEAQKVLKEAREEGVFDLQQTVEGAAEFMNKHHAALDTITEAYVYLTQGRVNDALAVLKAFCTQYDTAPTED